MKRFSPKRRHAIAAALVIGALFMGLGGTAMAEFITANFITAPAVNPVTATVNPGFSATVTAAVTGGALSPGTNATGTGSVSDTITYTLTDNLASEDSETATGASYAISGTPPAGCSLSDYSAVNDNTWYPMLMYYNSPVTFTASVTMPPSANNEDGCAGWAPTIVATITGTQP